MAQEFVIQTHTSADGIVHVNVPEEWADRDVTLVLKPQPMPSEAAPHDQQEWLAFIAQTAGCLRDDPITRPPQGDGKD